jgi:hypothetical protein
MTDPGSFTVWHHRPWLPVATVAGILLHSVGDAVTIECVPFLRPLGPTCSSTTTGSAREVSELTDGRHCQS